MFAFLVGHWSMCDYGEWPGGGGWGGTTEEPGERLRGAKGWGLDKTVEDNKTLQFHNMPMTARALSV